MLIVIISKTRITSPNKAYYFFSRFIIYASTKLLNLPTSSFIISQNGAVKSVATPSKSNDSLFTFFASIPVISPN